MKFLMILLLALPGFGQSANKIHPRCPPRVILPPAEKFDANECLMRSQIRELQLMSDLVDLSKGCPVNVKLADQESSAFQASMEKCKDVAKKKKLAD